MASARRLRNGFRFWEGYRLLSTSRTSTMSIRMPPPSQNIEQIGNTISDSGTSDADTDDDQGWDDWTSDTNTICKSLFDNEEFPSMQEAIAHDRQSHNFVLDDVCKALCKLDLFFGINFVLSTYLLHYSVGLLWSRPIDKFHTKKCALRDQKLGRMLIYFRKFRLRKYYLCQVPSLGSIRMSTSSPRKKTTLSFVRTSFPYYLDSLLTSLHLQNYRRRIGATPTMQTLIRWSLTER